MKPGPLHWCLQAELIRRGGNRRFGKLIPVHEIDGMVRQLREQNKKEDEEKRVSGETKLSSIPDHGAQPKQGNPAIPFAPEGFGRFDFTQSESRARQLYYADDTWADERETTGGEVFLVGEIDESMDGPETWYSTQDRPLPKCVEQFVLNWLVKNATMKDWDVGIMQALELIASQGTKRMSQAALAELAMRQEEACMRTGETPSQISWSVSADMGDVRSQQLVIGGLEFTVLDYGDKLNIPLKLRKLLYEGSNLERNQCSIIHLSAGIEWHLQKRPNRFPLKNRVISTAAEMRVHEYERAVEMMDRYNSSATDDMNYKICKVLCRDVINASHDRDFRFWSLFNGREVQDHALCVRIVEINSAETQTRVYNYCGPNADTPDKAIYLLAHRGHMRFMKQSRLTTDTRWENWKEHFGTVTDMNPAPWGGLGNLQEMLRMDDNRTCRRCNEIMSVRLQYPGIKLDAKYESRVAGRHQKKLVRTDEERKEHNRIWTEKYNKMAGIGERIEMPGLNQATFSQYPETVHHRTGMIREVNLHEPKPDGNSPARDQAELPTFYPHPKTFTLDGSHAGVTSQGSNTIDRVNIEEAAPRKRVSLIEMNWPSSNTDDNEPVTMKISQPQANLSDYDWCGRRTGTRTANYPIHDIEWRNGIVVQETTWAYHRFVRSRHEYSRGELEEVIRLGNQMVISSGGYRQAARELQEINLSMRQNLITRIEGAQHIFPAIAPQILEIARLGAIPEYRGLMPGGQRAMHYPYVSADTEKIAKKLWNDIRAGIMVICESDVASGGDQVVSHSSSVAHKKMPDRALSVDYRIISDLRQINLGHHKEDFYPVEVVKLADMAKRILKLKRQYPSMLILMTKRDVASAFRRILLHPDLIHIFTTDIPGAALDRKADLFFRTPGNAVWMGGESGIF